MKYISIKEFCERFQCSRTFVYRLAQRGKIKIVKLGRASRISVDDIEQWAASLPTVGGER